MVNEKNVSDCFLIEYENKQYRFLKPVMFGCSNVGND